MMHRAWSSIVEVPYCFSRSYIKFQGHTALKIIEFDPNWAFPDCNSSLNSPMAMKCCTKLETAKERCPIVFQGHPSNFKVTRYKISPILTQIVFPDYRPVAAFKSLRFALVSEIHPSYSNAIFSVIPTIPMPYFSPFPVILMPFISIIEVILIPSFVVTPFVLMPSFSATQQHV